jgi:polyphosphate kinase
MEAMIRREIDHARAGRGGHIRAKMNALLDPSIIDLLYEAYDAGVVCELLVRGMCSLRPGVEGLSENIRVISVIGRFLEHSRLFLFANGGQREIYLGSADWMPRNLDRRVEAVVPIEDPVRCDQLEALFSLYADDNASVWDMQPDGGFVQRQPEEEERRVQVALMQRWRGGLRPER